MENHPRVLKWSLGLLVLLVCILIGYFGYQAQPNSQDQEPLAASLPVETSKHDTLHANEFPPSVSRKKASTPPSTASGSKPSKAEREIIDATVVRIHEVLADAELKGAKVLERYEAGTAIETAFELPQIPQKAIEGAYTELDRGLKNLPANPALQERLRSKGLQKIAEFTDRPKPLKVVIVRIPHESSDYIGVDEFLVDDLKSLQRDANGTRTFRVGDGPGTVILIDGAYETKDDWAYKRYSHFFEPSR